MISETVNVAPLTKLLTIGRTFVSDRDLENPNTVKLTTYIDKNIGINLTFGPGAQISHFINTRKRNGVNPNTGENYNDPDYNTAVSLPTAIVEAEVARQIAMREEAKLAAPIATPLNAAPSYNPTEDIAALTLRLKLLKKQATTAVPA